MGILNFFSGASKYTSVDPSDVERAGESAERHLRYHKRIVLFGTAGAIVGAIPGIVVAFLGGDEKNPRMTIMAPVLSAAAGAVLGVALACTFAPREFLTGPLGEKWMKLIGTKSVLTARIVCLVLGLIIISPVVLIGVLFALGD